MTDSKTTYINVRGKVSWPKIYTPDEFRGAVNWTLNLYPENDAEWDKIKKAGLQGKPKDDDGSSSGVEGKYITLRRPTTKLMKGKLVYFAPPHIWDADGKPILKYVGADNKLLNSYDSKDTKVTAVGEQISLGNGSVIDLRISVYPTAMGIGNRFEAIKVIDLIEYERPEDVTDEVNSSESDEAPW